MLWTVSPSRDSLSTVFSVRRRWMCTVVQLNIMPEKKKSAKEQRELWEALKLRVQDHHIRDGGSAGSHWECLYLFISRCARLICLFSVGSLHLGSAQPDKGQGLRCVHKFDIKINGRKCFLLDRCWATSHRRNRQPAECNHVKTYSAKELKSNYSSYFVSAWVGLCVLEFWIPVLLIHDT